MNANLYNSMNNDDEQEDMIPFSNIGVEHNGHISIGNVFYSGHRFLLENSVDAAVFYSLEHDSLLHGFLEASTVIPNWPHNEIVQFVWEPIERNSILFYHTCVLKTHYLRLVQRRWRKIFTERRQILEGNAMLFYLRERERSGNRVQLPILPGLRGMLAHLTTR